MHLHSILTFSASCTRVLHVQLYSFLVSVLCLLNTTICRQQIQVCGWSCAAITSPFMIHPSAQNSLLTMTQYLNIRLRINWSADKKFGHRHCWLCCLETYLMKCFLLIWAWRVKAATTWTALLLEMCPKCFTVCYTFTQTHSCHTNVSLYCILPKETQTWRQMELGNELPTLNLFMFGITSRLCISCF